MSTSRNGRYITNTRQEYSLPPLPPPTPPPVPPAPKLEEDPVNYHRSYPNKGKGLTTLTLTSYDAKKDKIKVSSASFITEGNDIDCNEMDAQSLFTIESVGVLLHTVLINQDKLRKPPKRTILTTTSASQAESTTQEGLKSTAMLDYSPLHRFVFSLSYGDRLHKYNRFNPEAVSTPSDMNYKFKNDVVWGKVLIQSWAISDLLRHFRAESPGVLKKIVAANLISFGAAKQTYDFLNKLGISTCYRTVTRQSYKDSAGKIEAGIGQHYNMNRHSVIYALFDNVGYRLGGGFDKVGYLSLTMLATSMVQVEDLIKWGIYPDPSNPGRRLLRRDVKIWDTERQKDEVTFESVVAPEAADYNRLGETMFTVVETVLKMVADGTMMTHEDAIFLLENNVYEYIYEMPDPVTVQRPVPEDGNHCRKTHFEQNHAVVDNVVPFDLAKKETCKILAAYINQVKNHVLQSPEHKDLVGKTPITKKIPVMLACDGQPAGQIQRMILSKEITEQTQTLVAGFHLTLSAYKALGKLFAESHLREFFKCWRQTEGQLKWVLEPGDPNQVEDELMMLFTGLLSDAVVQYVQQKKKQVDNQTEFAVTPVDIVDHIMERSAKYPMVNAITLMFPIVGMILMLQGAEEAADWEAYHSVMKLLGSMCASAHQTGYVYLITRYFVNWFCASEAEREIQAKAYLFKKTVNGANIFCDRWVEWTVRYLRQTTGKKAKSKEYTTVVQRACLFLNDRCKIKLEDGVVVSNGDTSNTERGRSGLKLDKVFQETMILSATMNLWGTGDPRYVPGAPFKVRRDKQGQQGFEFYGTSPPGELKIPSGKHGLNEQIFFWYSIGSKRCKEYFNTYEKNAVDPTRTRSEVVNDGGVPLTCIEAIASKAAESARIQVEKWISVDETFLKANGVITLADLKKDFRYLNELLPPAMRIRTSQIPAPKNKGEYVSTVVLLRHKVKTLDENWEANRRAQKAPEIVDATEERRRQELDLPVYSFKSTAVREKFQGDDHKYRFKGTRVAEEAVQMPVPQPVPQPDSPAVVEHQNNTITSSQLSSPSTGMFAGRSFKWRHDSQSTQ